MRTRPSGNRTALGSATCFAVLAKVSWVRTGPTDVKILAAVADDAAEPVGLAGPPLGCFMLGAHEPLRHSMVPEPSTLTRPGVEQGSPGMPSALAVAVAERARAAQARMPRPRVEFIMERA
ncbi:unannotated protein [freshwater metagenome]|uniref:Unannotated protein n=1 Tax=freshwater metagenome TaxID=449393 RepID=A0A6J7E1V4_9ZZZZ